jgi:uncharacterized repeat protein (TIGR04076 family)
MVKAIKVKPVEVTGHCRAGLTLDDEFLIDGSNLLNPRQSNICIGALSHLPPVVSALQEGKQLHAHARCQSCTGVGQENRVVFLLGHADAWELCVCLSEYSRLCTEGGLRQAQDASGEPLVARQLKVEATELQRRGDYTGALHKMEAALEEMHTAVACRETWLYYNR